MYLGECEAIRGETLCPVTSLLLSCDTHGWLCKHWQEGSQCFFVHVNMSQGQQLELISRLIRCKCFLPRTLCQGSVPNLASWLKKQFSYIFISLSCFFYPIWNSQMRDCGLCGLADKKQIQRNSKNKVSIVRPDYGRPPPLVNFLCSSWWACRCTCLPVLLHLLYDFSLCGCLSSRAFVCLFAYKLTNSWTQLRASCACA